MAIIITSGNDTIKVLGFKGTHKIDNVKALAIIITFGSDILKVLGFKSIQKKGFKVPTFFTIFFKICYFDDFFQNISQDLEIYWNIDHQKAKKLKKKQRRKE